MQPESHGYWQPANTPPEGDTDTVSAAIPPVEAQDATEVTHTADAESAPPLMPSVSWEASEFVHHERNTVWFVGVVAMGVVLLGLSIWLHAWTFTAVVVVMVAAIFFMALRPPRVLRYQLSDNGLDIEQNHYSYKDFRAFGVVQEDAVYYITLLPIKRFMPAIDVYFPQEYGEQIVDALGAHIPMQTVKPDAIDDIMKRLRF